MNELIAAMLALLGAVLFGLAALALHRMPDIYGRLSATSKAVTLGSTALLAAAGIHTMDAGVTARAIAGIAFMLVTSPIASHMLGRASWRSGMEATVTHQDPFPTGPGARPETPAAVRAAEEREAEEHEAEADDTES